MFVQNRLGLIESLETMRLQTEKLNQISNNLANTDTTGYKKDHVAFQEVLSRTADGRQRIGKGLKVTTDFRPEHVEETGNPLHVAITGEGFFRIQTPDGIRYTRDGAFHLNGENQLVTRAGDPVLGEGGTIQLGRGPLHIDPRGNITSGGELADRLAVVSFADLGVLGKEGDNLYRLQDGAAGEELAGDSSVRQGYLETSGVEAMSEMLAMIELTRATESQQKVIRTIDELDGMAVRQVGKLAG